jgi:elongation factor G
MDFFVAGVFTQPGPEAEVADANAGGVCEGVSTPPWPIVEIAIEPKSKADQEKLGVALQKLAAADQTLRVSVDRESGQIVMGGLSELHLATKIDILKQTYEVKADVGAPQVTYRETLGRRAEIDYTHKRQTGGSGQFARVKIVFERNEPGAGYAFESKIVGGSVPKEYVPGIEKGLESAKDNGLLAGFPVIDFKATLVDGAYHDVDSSVLTFEIAARAAFRELRDVARPTLLWPIMKVEVTTPEDYVGDVIGDLNSRRGQIHGFDERGNAQVIIAMVPLANMFGYVNNLRSMSQGRANFHMEYDHYEAVPQATPPDDTFPSAMAMRA